MSQRTYVLIEKEWQHADISLTTHSTCQITFLWLEREIGCIKSRLGFALLGMNI